MPLYSFSCTNEKCLNEFETVVPRNTESKPCPKCDYPSTRKLTAGQRFLFNWLADE